MNLSLIAAVGKNNELGKDNDLIWRLKGDMRFFKNTTMGHHLIMGRKTFESLPKLLEGRKHLVLSRNGLDFPSAVETFDSVSKFLALYNDFDGEIFNIGGASIYEELIDYANKLYLTEIDDSYADADVFFPYFDKSLYDKEILEENFDDDKKVEYKHVLYKRK
jgi:dihydrofolate reductase